MDLSQFRSAVEAFGEGSHEVIQIHLTRASFSSCGVDDREFGAFCQSNRRKGTMFALIGRQRDCFFGNLYEL